MRKLDQRHYEKRNRKKQHTENDYMRKTEKREARHGSNINPAQTRRA